MVAPGGRAAGTPAPAVPETAKRGFVVYVDTTRIVVDLNASDGLRVGAVISLRRDRIPIVHPVTGEVLGELDEEVGTARITELRDKFSVAEIQTVAAGAQVQVKDRVVQK
jgi:bifunctional DNase/RNase